MLLFPHARYLAPHPDWRVDTARLTRQGGNLEMATSSLEGFGDLLRRYRLAAGLTQEQLAALAGMSARGLSDLERGARRVPRRETVLLLSGALNLSQADRTLLESAARQQFEAAREICDRLGERLYALQIEQILAGLL